MEKNSYFLLSDGIFKIQLLQRTLKILMTSWWILILICHNHLNVRILGLILLNKQIFGKNRQFQTLFWNFCCSFKKLLSSTVNCQKSWSLRSLDMTLCMNIINDGKHSLRFPLRWMKFSDRFKKPWTSFMKLFFQDFPNHQCSAFLDSQFEFGKELSFSLYNKISSKQLSG